MPESRDSTIFPVLPLRDIVVFPHMIVPLLVGRERSVNALKRAMADDKQILLVSQKEDDSRDPTVDDLYEMGTLGTVLQMIQLPKGDGMKALVEGGRRVRIVGESGSDEYLRVEVDSVVEEEADAPDEDVEVLMNTVINRFEEYLKLNRKIPPEVLVSLNQIEDVSKLADTIASHLALNIPDKQALLETLSPVERLKRAHDSIGSEIDLLQVEKRIRGRVKRQMEKTQREYFLNEQLKAIQKELGGSEEGGDELGELKERIAKTKFTKEAREKAGSELKKLGSMSPMSAEATVVRNYLDWLLGIPWRKRTRVKKDIALAEKILNEDHYGLDKVKERILEYLAVQIRVGKVKGPILCLVGPPGVGKTSLGKSIARATGRNFVRISLGGVRDEAEIRGHRRTYIGSMPGKIIQGMKKAKSSNPMFLLDEIDKLGSDWRGDPSSALLEVLDPEQNHTFQDHYLEVDYDLSDVMFVTTANTLRMPQPLLDRMETIRLAGYTEDEKIGIAKQHLIPKQMEQHGLKAAEWSLSDKALRQLIHLYTREAGVRNLERELANLARKSVKELTTGDKSKVRITPRNLADYAGVPRYRTREIEDEDQVGVTTGLAWTEVGGALLQIEALVMPGKGNISHTGKLGDVMQESVQAARSYVRSRMSMFGIRAKFFDKRDIHVHVPEGATPKDGPSAGVAMCTSIVSALTGIPVRRDLAMTGEVTLRGRVLPIGGLKEKLLAALRAGTSTVLIPKDNEKDLADIPDNVKQELKIVPVTSVDEVLDQALTSTPIPIDWDDDEDRIAPVGDGDETLGNVVAH